MNARTLLLLVLPMFGTARDGFAAKNASKHPSTYQFELISVTISRNVLAINYRLTNNSNQDIFFACTEPACGDPGRHLEVPFIESQEQGVLEISSLIAELPSVTLVELPYHHLFRRLPPGAIHGTIAIKVPTMTNPPYQEPEPVAIDIREFTKVRMVLGILPCMDPRFSPLENVNGPAFSVSAGLNIKCRGISKPLSKLQILVRAEKAIEDLGGEGARIGANGGSDGELDGGDLEGGMPRDGSFVDGGLPTGSGTHDAGTSTSDSATNATPAGNQRVEPPEDGGRVYTGPAVDGGGHSGDGGRL